MERIFLTTAALAALATFVSPAQQAVAHDDTQVARTGQTEIYDASGLNRDDGGLQKGVVWPVPRLKDTGKGTVKDRLTGLIWLKNANCGAGVTNWQGALNWVAELNANGSMNGQQCGDVSKGTGATATHEKDWRLPNRNELDSLLDLGTTFPALPAGHPFTDVQTNYWSSTTWAFASSYAFVVSLGYGIVALDQKTGSNSYNVTAVRGGSPPDIRTKYKFSYRFASGDVVTGSFTGTPAGNLITGLTDISVFINGVPFAGNGNLPNLGWIYNQQLPGNPGTAVASLDGTQNSFRFYELGFSAPIGKSFESYPYFGGPTTYASFWDAARFVFEGTGCSCSTAPYVPANWSVTVR
jgi:hypothetical protein